MKAGAENRRKTIMLGVLAGGALCGVLYNVYNVFGGSSTPPPSVAPVTSTATPGMVSRPGTVPVTSASPANAGNRNLPGAVGAVPGVAAQKLASTSSSLDPTLDQAAMLRTESLVYAGSGRNIFSATYVPPAPAIPRNVPPARPLSHPVLAAPVQMGPPPPPPIPLKFFGTAQRAHGAKQAFLLSGDDVYLAGPGDIVAKRFKVGQIFAYGIQVTDLTNNNTQTLPMQQ